MNRNFIAYNRKYYWLFLSSTHNRNIHFRTLCASYQFRYFRLFFSHTGNTRRIHMRQSIAWQHTHFLCRTSCNRLTHNHRVFYKLIRNTNPLKVSLNPLIHLRHILCRNIRRMWVQLLQHFHYCLFRQFTHIHCINIQIIKIKQKLRQLHPRLLQFCSISISSNTH